MYHLWSGHATGCSRKPTVGKQPLPDVLHLPTLLFVTVSEMSATFIKGEAPEHVGVPV